MHGWDVASVSSQTPSGSLAYWDLVEGKPRPRDLICGTLSKFVLKCELQRVLCLCMHEMLVFCGKFSSTCTWNFCEHERLVHDFGPVQSQTFL